MLVLISLTLVSAQQKLEYYESGDDTLNYPRISDNRWVGQTFRIGTLSEDTNFNITNIAVYMQQKEGNNVNYIWRILEVNASGHPNKTTEYCNATVSTATYATAGNNWYNHTLTDCPIFNASTSYALVVSTPTGDDGDRAGWRRDGAGSTYDGGNYTTSTDSGTTWVIPAANEFLFRIWGDLVRTVDVTLGSPANGTINLSRRHDFNATLIPMGLNLTNATIFIWNSSGSIFNSTTNVVLGNVTNTTTWNIDNLRTDIYEWNVLSCGINTTSTICSFANNNYTLDIRDFLENSITFNTTSFEFKVEDFSFNITYNSTAYTSISSNLYYNNTIYSTTRQGIGDTVIISRNLSIPTISGTAPINNSFYFEILLSNATGTFKFNSTINNQTIDEILFQFCNATFSTPIVVNFSIYDEDSRELINSSMDATFGYSLSGLNLFKNHTFDSNSSEISFIFCTNAHETFLVDSTISLNKTGYTARTYFFNDEEYTNITTQTGLYLLNSTKGSNIIVEVKDQGLAPLEGYFVTAARFYPSTNEYVDVIKEKTDEFGQFVARLIQNDVKYRFTFTNPSGTVVKVTDDITIACRTSICVLPFVVEDTTDDFERFTNISDFEYSLSFDNTTNVFTYSWNDITGESSTHRLLVQRVSFNGTVTVCNTSSTSTSSTLTCDVGSSVASYRGQGFREVSGDSTRVVVLNIKVGDPFGTFGREGLIWSFFLLFTLIAIGIFHPPTAVILYLVGFLGLGAIGIISFSIPIFFANLIIGVIFIWAFRR